MRGRGRQLAQLGGEYVFGLLPDIGCGEHPDRMRDQDKAGLPNPFSGGNGLGKLRKGRRHDRNGGDIQAFEIELVHDQPCGARPSVGLRPDDEVGLK